VPPLLTWVGLTIILEQIVEVAWIYGSSKFLSNIEEMVHLPAVFRVYWWFLWTLVCPVIIAAVVILKWYTYQPMR
jgi:hypothetical protein